MSQTTSPDPFGRSRTQISFDVAFAILVCLASILGNVLVIYVINKYSEMKTITTILIHNLALTDIFMATLNMPLWAASLYTGRWNFSQGWCDISATVLRTMGVASMLNMSLIALNRYIIVVKRALYIKFFPSKRVAWLYCGVVWLVSVSISVPMLFGWGKIKFHSDSFLCILSWKEGNFTFAIMQAAMFNVTTCTIFYCYWKIYQKVKESTNNINSNATQNGVGAPRFDRTDIKLLKTCFTVVCFFIMTWGTTFIVVSRTAARGYIPPDVTKVTAYLMYSSSLVNPIIYGVMNPQFKEAFKKALCCGCYGNDNADQNHARIVE
ncbi:melanopsin-like [Stylophora pistillata]|uniref:melanopsin-like n=1 Tax=Stylophora pistillata TaxID=50429 RepID=UPI000C04AAE2|nr:melanopsin-like [Stylophora pistillata]